MKSKGNNSIAFTVELFILFLILLVLIATITTVTVKARVQGLEAERLNGAVICAENVAEITSPARDAEKAADMMEEMDAIKVEDVDGNSLTAICDESEEDPVFIVRVNVRPQEGEAGTFVEKTIAVYEGDGKNDDSGAGDAGAGIAFEGEPIYTLETGRYFGEGQ